MVSFSNVSFLSDLLPQANSTLSASHMLAIPKKTGLNDLRVSYSSAVCLHFFWFSFTEFGN